MNKYVGIIIINIAEESIKYKYTPTNLKFNEKRCKGTLD